MKESDISVAIAYPGNRVDKIAIPLLATEMDVEVKPRRPYESDIVLLDNADRNMVWPAIRKAWKDAKIVYRMRGDVYRELETWDMSGWKKKIALDIVLPRMDGAIAVSEPLATKIGRKAGIPHTGVAGLAIDPADFPTTEHTREEIHALTLTNANYHRKIRPIIEWAPVVDRVLDEQGGGSWTVGGDGTFSYLLEHGLKGLEHVHYGGYLNATAALESANLMLHPSNLDGLPNGILEGMASKLPVITNDFEAFTSYGGPIAIADSEHSLRSMLETSQNPSHRERCGQRNLDYIIDHHSAERVGNQYVLFFQQLLRDVHVA